MRPGIDPKVDYAFKKLFGSEANQALLVHLLNAVLQLPPGRQVVGLQLLNPFNEKERADDKLSVVDVKARDQGGRQFHVEMQTSAQWFFPSRTLYYWSRLHAQQLLAGDYFQTLRPTISICFLNGVLFEQVPDYHTVFRLREERHQVTLTDDLAIHMLELPKLPAAEGLTGPCDAWCYFLRHAEELDADALPEALGLPPIRQAMEVLRVLSQSEIERERYESALRAGWEQATRAEAFRRATEDLRQACEEASQAREEASQAREEASQAREEASQAREEASQARERGELIGRIHLCQRVLKQALTSREELLALALPDLARLADGLEQQLPAAP
jgi:predicted transposase/invertase (TIGR01784 family)